MTGIYVHIPFCLSRCIYCGFYSTVAGKSLQERYIEAVKKELETKTKTKTKTGTFTIYFGGGTPSVLEPHLLADLTKAIKQAFTLANHDIAEFTVECNPDDITPHLIENLKDMGVNRISMGVQTFSNERLRFLRRRHTAEQIPLAMSTLRKAGIENISIDLMFGFPYESLEDWQSDLRQSLSLHPTHISAYSLMYEEGTPLHQMLTEGRINESDEETCRQMYETLIDTLTSAGYEHYEISNFALPGYRALHNSLYWNDSPYIGLGASAHSYDHCTRSWNVSNVEQYIRDAAGSRQGETIDPLTHYNDTVTTALRTREGIDTTKVEEPYRTYLLASARKGILQGNLVMENNHLHLTRKGLFISDDVMSNLIKV